MIEMYFNTSKVQEYKQKLRDTIEAGYASEKTKYHTNWEDVRYQKLTEFDGEMFHVC